METPVGAPFKVKLRLEIAKLREMPFKKKMEYIWDYYKLPIIIIGAILIFIGSLINTLIINPAPDTVLHISWNSGYALDGQLNDLSNVIKEQVVEEGKNETVDILLYMESDDPTYNMANAQRMIAMLAAGAIDVFVLNSEQLVVFAENEFLQPVDHLMAGIRAKNPDIFNKIEENAVIASYSSNGNRAAERIMGFDISQSPLLSELGFFEQESIFCISISSHLDKLDNVIQALILFFE